MRLKDLASAAGCSESLLSRIENGLVMPSLVTLHRLCKALDINVTLLLNRAEDQSCVVYDADERPSYTKGGWAEGDGTVAESLVPYADDRLLEAHILHIPPNRIPSGPLRHAGEEVGYILEGELELTVQGNTYVLHPGASFFFRSELEHFYRALGDAPCRVIWINTPPTF